MLKRELSDGLVMLRPSTLTDVPVLVAGRDEVFHRFLGEGDPTPRPTACIVVRGVVVGWVDYDHDRPWLEATEVNVGYNVFAEFRRNGYATRAVRLLMRHLAEDTDWEVATLLIDSHNDRSLALARRAGFERVADLDGSPYWKQRVALVSVCGSRSNRHGDRGGRRDRDRDRLPGDRRGRVGDGVHRRADRRC